MRCHFVYAVPIKGQLGRLRRKAVLKLQEAGVSMSWFGSRSEPDMSWWPRRTPYEKTRRIFEAISSHAPTWLYCLDERVRCRFSADDIFLGHPHFPFQAGRNGVTELSIRQHPRPRIFALISPLHCNTEIRTNHINEGYLKAVDKLVPHADILFAIMGQYWWDKWPKSPFAHWIPKMVRLDNAVDAHLFPWIRQKFNPPGKRGYLYIGRNDPMKGTDFLSKLALELREFRWGWIGGGSEIPAVSRLSTNRPLTPDFVRKVANKFDFFVSPSRADPNPTTILESMAWGFPVICTPQSGYYETSYIKNIYHEDFDRSVEVLRQLQFADEQRLKKIAVEAREVVQREYTWEHFIGTICENLGLE